MRESEIERRENRINNGRKKKKKKTIERKKGEKYGATRHGRERGNLRGEVASYR